MFRKYSHEPRIISTRCGEASSSTELRVCNSNAAEIAVRTVNAVVRLNAFLLGLKVFCAADENKRRGTGTVLDASTRRVGNANLDNI